MLTTTSSCQHPLVCSIWSNDRLLPLQEEEGICTSKFFSENGLLGLLEQAATLFKEAHLYEAMNEIYKLVIPIYEARRSYQELEKVHRKLGDCYKELVHRGEHRFLGSYFRVGFYGILFGDLDRHEFIYKEAALTRLSEFSLKLQVRCPGHYSDHGLVAFEHGLVDLGHGLIG